MKKYRVELHHWRNQQGYLCSEVFDNLDEKCTAEEYVKDYDGDLSSPDPEDAINIEIYDNETDELISEYWLQNNIGEYIITDNDGHVIYSGIQAEDEEDAIDIFIESHPNYSADEINASLGRWS